MSQFTTQQFYQPPPTNSLGIAGFIVSLSGLIVCFGLTCPIGLAISLIALMSAPRGYAIAGVIIGMLGSIMGTALALMYFGVIGQGWFFSPNYTSQSQTYYEMQVASSNIDSHYNSNNNTLPDAATGTSLISSHFDEWGNAMTYTPTPNQGHDYEIASAGPDGQFGNSDDYVEIFWINTWNAQPAFPAQSPGGATEDQIEAAFDQAAKQITENFPPNATLPDPAKVDERAGVLMDAWSTPMRYSPTANPPFYHLKSAGPDGQWDTDDDITRSFYFSPTGEADGPL